MTMKLLVTFLFLLATTVTWLSAWQLEADCGIKGPSNFERIIGGIEAAPHEFPWQVVLARQAICRCGASILNKDWLITAAHCLHGHVDAETTYYFGTNDNPCLQTQPSVLNRTSKITFTHHNYNFTTLESDIALVKLSESLPLGNASAHIGTICLPEPEPNINAHAYNTSIVSGFGTVTSGSQLGSKELRKVNVTIWNQTDCTVAYDTLPDNVGFLFKGRITENTICAGSYGKDSCQGDSGGPMVTFNAKTGRWQLTGIVSWGDRCAVPYHPGVYTRVTKFLPWIQETIQKYSD